MCRVVSQIRTKPKFMRSKEYFIKNISLFCTLRFYVHENLVRNVLRGGLLSVCEFRSISVRCERPFLASATFAAARDQTQIFFRSPLETSIPRQFSVLSPFEEERSVFKSHE